jgi:hypothetical protein
MRDQGVLLFRVVNGILSQLGQGYLHGPRLRLRQQLMDGAGVWISRSIDAEMSEACLV